MSRRKRIPPEYVTTRPSAASGQRELLEQTLRGRGRVGDVAETGHERVLPSVRISSTAANWPVRLNDVRARDGWTMTSYPSTIADRRSCASSVATMCTSVVLPAPFDRVHLARWALLGRDLLQKDGRPQIFMLM